MRFICFVFIFMKNKHDEDYCIVHLQVTYSDQTTDRLVLTNKVVLPRLFSFTLPSSSSSFGRVPHFQMLAVMVLSQHRVSTSKTVSPRIPVGARCTGHVRMMCSAVCSAAPHSQFDVGARPHLCMNN